MTDTPMTDISEIVLHQPSPRLGVPNASPFCAKLEAWLRMAEVPYRVDPVFDPRKGPKGKIPFAEIDGETIGDSEFIILTISERRGVDLDEGLNAEERGVSLALTRMMEEHLYWVAVQARWLEPAPFAVLKKVFFGRMPPGLRQLVPIVYERRVRRMLQGQGLGRHTPAEIYRKGTRDLQALSDVLGAKPFFMGETPRTVDATAYGLLTNIIDMELETPLKPIACGFPNLVDYTARMRAKYFAEFDAKAA